MSGTIVCLMPGCQTAAGCRCPRPTYGERLIGATKEMQKRFNPQHSPIQNLLNDAFAAGRLQGIREAAEVVIGLDVPLPPEMDLDEPTFSAATTAFSVAASLAIEALAKEAT